MAKKIYIETEEYTGGDQGDFYTFALSGDTYDAKEIIKSLGYSFSDQVGRGKAWRTEPILKSDFVPGNPAFLKIQNQIKKTGETLKTAGYEFGRR